MEKFSSYTPIKQKIFSQIIGLEFSIVNQIITSKHAGSDWMKPYMTCIDTTCGSGFNGKQAGSPILLIEEANRYRFLKTKILMIDNDRECIDLLRFRLDGMPLHKNVSYSVIHADNTKHLRHIMKEEKKWQFGFIYNDPNGNIPIFDMLRKVSDLRQYHPLDIIINCPATTIKRVACADHCDEKRRLNEYLNPIKKNKWFISKPVGKHQWVFLFGTNAPSRTFNENKFGHIPLYCTENETGNEIFNYICKTGKE